MNQRDEMVSPSEVWERVRLLAPEMDRGDWSGVDGNGKRWCGLFLTEAFRALESKGYRILSPEAARVAGAAIDEVMVD